MCASLQQDPTTLREDACSHAGTAFSGQPKMPSTSGAFALTSNTFDMGQS